MSSLQLLIIIFYKTLQDYDSNRPAAIYVITPRRNHKLAIEKARILENKYKGVEVKILIEGKHKEEIDKVINLCLEASKILSPSIW
jgi:predicted transcriptional regulator of viral defense system